MMPATQLGSYSQRNLDLAARPAARPLPAAEPDVFAALQRRLDTLLRDVERVRILNAGCGRGDRYVPVTEHPHVVGIDIEAGATGADDELDERVVGDLETHDFGPQQFDVVYCWDVLEHLRDPRGALLNLISTLRPGGIIILGLPHTASVKGLITRCTPDWFHRWLWRHVLHPKSAVDEAPMPFPTVLASAMTPSRILAFARAHALSVEFYAEYEAWPQKKVRMMLRLTGRAFTILASTVRLLSLGKLTASATDLVIVLRKAG